MPKLRICFAGTPAFAAAHLAALAESQHEIAAVYTQPDRPAGRGKKLQSSAVKLEAQRQQITVLQPISLKTADQELILRELNPDVLVVVAYGLILPKSILDIPRLGCINVHASLLPRWRGAAPIERAILAGDSKTGVTIMQMDEGLDTGDMLSVKAVTIDDMDTRLTVESKLITAGCGALVRTLDELMQKQQLAEPQDNSLSTYATKLEKQESLIDWAVGAIAINRQVRASIGRNPAYTFLNADRLRILSAEVLPPSSSLPPGGTILEVSRDYFDIACADSILRVRGIQLPGKKPGLVRDLVNSNPAWLIEGFQFSNSLPDAQ